MTYELVHVQDVPRYRGMFEFYKETLSNLSPGFYVDKIDWFPGFERWVVFHEKN